ncbi:hypothetical protein PTE_01283 [Photorhabdus khanii NC19]|uniref:Uncharacterized protein n=1 Tax=Photorhabdus khanii NC19 TaxID=1004151 RepID=W3VC12_9GAMM|nr:hypothetical protein PTE_01283 [Photorhabdus khanii NC19]
MTFNDSLKPAYHKTQSINVSVWGWYFIDIVKNSHRQNHFFYER